MVPQQHYQIGMLRLQEGENQADHVFAYRLAAEAEAHFMAGILLALLGGDRELLTPGSPPSSASTRMPL